MDVAPVPNRISEAPSASEALHVVQASDLDFWATFLRNAGNNPHSFGLHSVTLVAPAADRKSARVK